MDKRFIERTLISTHNQLYKKQKIMSEINNETLMDDNDGPNNGKRTRDKTIRIPLSNERELVIIRGIFLLKI